MKKKLNFFKKLNILEEQQLKDYEENVNEKNRSEKKEKTIKITDDKGRDHKKRKTRFNRLKYKKEGKLIYDNSYLFKKSKKKKEIKDVIKKIINTDYSTSNNNNNNNNDSNNDSNNDNSSNENSNNQSAVNASFYSCKNRRIKSKIKGKSKLASRRNSVFSCIGENLTSKFRIKLDDEENLKREEEMRRKRMEIEQKRRREEILDRKLYDFFDKIKKMKDNDIDYQDLLEKLINEHSNNVDNTKEIRINTFIHRFQLNREKEKFYVSFKNKMLGYTSPLVFTMNNFYSKSKDILENSKNDNNMHNRTAYNSNINK
jgi:hypothetical protein